VGERWRIEAEDEVDEWLLKLSARDAARARLYLELLAEQGSALSMPYVRSLGGGLRELRFHLRDEQRRIIFWIAPDRRIVLLTTFRKQRQSERREVERAQTVRQRVQQEFNK